MLIAFGNIARRFGVGPTSTFGPRCLRYVLTSDRSRVKVARSSPVGLRVRRTWRFKEIDLLPRREGTSRNGWQPTADTLLTMELRTQPVATHGNGLGLFLPLPRLVDLPTIATTCDHGAP